MYAHRTVASNRQFRAAGRQGEDAGVREAARDTFIDLREERFGVLSRRVHADNAHLAVTQGR
jgi:hypothetical protein